MAAQYSSVYWKYLLNRGCFRTLVRRVYLARVRQMVKGKCIDLGCGAGELLRLLPKGSIGLEINREAVSYLVSQGLDVREYNIEAQNTSLLDIVNLNDKVEALVSSHVLEHLGNPRKFLAQLFSSAFQLKIDTIIIVVPGVAGYKSDKTHLTFVDETILLDEKLLANGHYTVVRQSYFPMNFKIIGNIFIHHELMVCYRRC